MSDSAADKATERLWQLPWADPEARKVLVELLLHKDIPELVAEVRRLTDALDELKADRSLFKGVADRGGW